MRASLRKSLSYAEVPTSSFSASDSSPIEEARDIVVLGDEKLASSNLPCGVRRGRPAAGEGEESLGWRGIKTYGKNMLIISCAVVEGRCYSCSRSVSNLRCPALRVCRQREVGEIGDM